MSMPTSGAVGSGDAAAVDAAVAAVSSPSAAAANASDDASRVSFVCHRCLQPLRIDPSFHAMNEHTQVSKDPCLVLP